jgi:hypothetical protein
MCLSGVTVTVNNSYEKILHNLLLFSKSQDYKGYDKHDGLLSPVLSPIMGYSKLLRIIAIQSVMRCPLNIRPLLMVPRTRNAKGIGLFAYAYLNYYELTNNRDYLEEAEQLLTWLEENVSPEFPGCSWGYQYPWQDIGFFAPTGFPNRVVTCWIGFSFIRRGK